MASVVKKLGNISNFVQTDDFGDTSTGASVMVRTLEIFVSLGGLVDVDEEVNKAEAELEHQKEFLATVRKKLSNESFMAHAPAKVIELEHKKEADSLSKIESLEIALKALKNN